MEKKFILLFDFDGNEKSILKDFFSTFNFEISFRNSSSRFFEIDELQKYDIIVINFEERNLTLEEKLINYIPKLKDQKFIIFCHFSEFCKLLSDLENVYIYKIVNTTTVDNFYQTVLEAFKQNFSCSFFGIDIPLEALYHQKKKYFKILQLAKKLSSDINLDSLLEKIVDFTCDVLEAERATVFLIDKEKNELWSRVGVGIDKKEIRFSLFEGIAGEVARTGVTALINDPYNHPHFNKKIDQETGFITRNILCAPLWNLNGEIIGVFQVLNKIDGEFTKDDEDCLYTFSTNAAKSIENAQLYEERAKQLEQLQRSYKELQEAQERILRQEKLATIGQVFAGITHEVKNQLTIVSAVSSIKRLYPDDKKIETYTNLILEARNRIINLLDEIRNFSKKTNYEKEEIELINLVTSTIEFCKFDKLLEFIKIEFNKPEFESIFIYANEDKIKQVLINLIRNAAQASQQYSKIIINIDLFENEVILTVQDFGCGIPYENQNLVWEPFFTTKKEGTGLGLDICKKIIEDHNGKIYFKSEPEKGTTFFIQLPAIRM